ncbi:MAG: hypothetical protein LUE27_06325 [Clostridia bacterium]|nr:hypothetical protein [Clostridia bacterium]
MGTGYKGGASHHHSISENLPNLTSIYPYHDWYFGKRGQGGSHTRNIICDDPVASAQKFYEIASYGGIEHNMDKGVYTNLTDGTIVSYREVSSSDGTPVVEINIRSSTDSGGVKQQKIHFVKG